MLPSVKEFTNRLRNKDKKKSRKYKNPNAWVNDTHKIKRTTPPSCERIYALYLNENGSDIVYVGRTTRSINIRLKEHLQESKTGKSKKCAGIREHLENGHTINIREIEVCSPNNAGEQEDFWISNLMGAGIKLLNTIEAPCMDDYIPNMDNVVASVWNHEDFKDGWKKGHGKANKTEWHKEINSIDFFRTGRSKLRFSHSVYGEWACGGVDWAMMVCNAMNYFLPGTEQRKRIIDHLNKNHS